MFESVLWPYQLRLSLQDFWGCSHEEAPHLTNGFTAARMRLVNLFSTMMDQQMTWACCPDIQNYCCFPLLLYFASASFCFQAVILVQMQLAPSPFSYSDYCKCQFSVNTVLCTWVRFSQLLFLPPPNGQVRRSEKSYLLVLRAVVRAMDWSVAFFIRLLLKLWVPAFALLPTCAVAATVCTAGSLLAAVSPAKQYNSL